MDDRRDVKARSGTLRKGARPRASKAGVQPWYPEVSASRSMRTRLVDGKWVRPAEMEPGFVPRKVERPHMQEYAMKKEGPAVGAPEGKSRLTVWGTDSRCVECKTYLGHSGTCGRRG